MGFPYRLNTRYPIQLWVWFEWKHVPHQGKDCWQPVNVRYARGQTDSRDCLATSQFDP